MITIKKFFIVGVLLLSCLSLGAQNALSALLPMPNKVEMAKGKPFKVAAGQTVIVCTDAALRFEAEQLADIIQHRMDITLPVTEKLTKKAIVIGIDSSLNGDEHYQLTVNSKGMRLVGATAAAVFRGIMTIDQLLLGDAFATSLDRISAIHIDDAPRFGYRALMLDPARHFLPLKDVKFYIDQMARYKYNVLQLHLTDDQGWRIEIKSQPRLASKQHYTQTEIRELIDYAALRHIQIVPEIDVPGHTAAVLAAFPELSCRHLQVSPVKVGETTNRMVCGANPKTYAVLHDVIHEICALFDAPYFHLGGDEAAVPANWAKCPDCRALMQQYGYTKPTQLMQPFFDKVLGFVREGGKRPILWCELNNIYPPATDYLFPYPKDVTLVTWRNQLTPTCLDLTHKSGHQLLMAPGEYAYFDYPQWKGDFPEHGNWGMPITSLQQSYGFDPGYGRARAEQSHISGVMGTLWGEAIRDINRATYMTYPRGLALAEAGWTQMEHRNWKSFKQRLYPNLMNLMQLGVSVRVPFEIAR